MTENVTNLFKSDTKSIESILNDPGIGYYIPLYQRPYRWTKQNVDKLMEDICKGVDAIVNTGETIHFMGTVIFVKVQNENEIQPQESSAIPGSVKYVIDGQQRLSTISLLSCLLYQRIYGIQKNLPRDQAYDLLRSAAREYLELLRELFSVDLRGVPRRKPIIIRASDDMWKFTDTDGNSYKSDVSQYLSSFIRVISNVNTYSEVLSFPSATPGLVDKNIRAINSWLNLVSKAYEDDNEAFPTAWKIVEKFDEKDIWFYEQTQSTELIKSRSNPLVAKDKKVCSLVQLFAFCHFLMKRCCLTVTNAYDETSAFGMFQSLNGTGTPLTALETFKAVVVNTSNSQDGGFRGSLTEANFKKVDDFIEKKIDTDGKNKLTDDYLTTFAAVSSGTKLSTQFNVQRLWLEKKYSSCSSKAEREEFVQRMGDLSSYWKDVIGFDPIQHIAIPTTNARGISVEERKLVSLCILYLEEANHKMARTILSRFYAQVVRGKQNAVKDFVAAVKAVTAFFTLWRSSLPNRGLDEVYRNILRESMSWEKGDTNLTSSTLKSELKRALANKGIHDQASWKMQATVRLKYEIRTICKFALFITSHDTIPDPHEPGLMTSGASRVSPYLDPGMWVSRDLSSIEHIAPANPSNTGWDSELYKDEVFQRVGNLTLLPIEINCSVSNKGWIEKWIYYNHLSESDPIKLSALQATAQADGITLNPDTVELLERASYARHIEPIAQLGAGGIWNRDLVVRKTDRMCDILWTYVYPWLN